MVHHVVPSSYDTSVPCCLCVVFALFSGPASLLDLNFQALLFDPVASLQDCALNTIITRNALLGSGTHVEAMMYSEIVHETVF